jgi:hypothetical protein
MTAAHPSLGEAAGTPDGQHAQADQQGLLGCVSQPYPLVQAGNQVGYRHVDHARGGQGQHIWQQVMQRDQ